jgi:hypothetical protein
MIFVEDARQVLRPETDVEGIDAVMVYNGSPSVAASGPAYKLCTSVREGNSLQGLGVICQRACQHRKPTSLIR